MAREGSPLPLTRDAAGASSPPPAALPASPERAEPLAVPEAAAVVAPTVEGARKRLLRPNAPPQRLLLPGADEEATLGRELRVQVVRRREERRHRLLFLLCSACSVFRRAQHNTGDLTSDDARDDDSHEDEAAGGCGGTVAMSPPCIAVAFQRGFGALSGASFGGGVGAFLLLLLRIRLR